MNVDTFVKEHGDWVRANFPDQPPYLPAAGAFEECGEIMQALVKIDQVKRWGQEPRHADRDWRAELEDAIGDCAIYLDSLANACDLDWAWCYVASKSFVPATSSMLCAARLSRVLSELLERTLLGGRIESRCWEVSVALACLHGLSHPKTLDTILDETWTRVKTRHR